MLLFPGGRSLSPVFRGKLLHQLSTAMQDGRLGLGGAAARRQLREAAARKWVVYSKAPMAGPEQVIQYLGRYTHRIAITNGRIVSLEHSQVTFSYRNRRRGNRQKQLTLGAADFIRRFLAHVLPRSFVRIRHYGLLANGCRTRLLTRARVLLNAPAPPEAGPSTTTSWRDLYRRLLGRDPDLCPSCGIGHLRSVALLAPAWANPISARAP